MTTLEREVRRLVKQPRRDLVVSLRNVDGVSVVGVREKGRRLTFEVPVASLYVILAQRSADNARAARKRKRGAR